MIQVCVYFNLYSYLISVIPTSIDDSAIHSHSRDALRDQLHRHSDDRFSQFVDFQEFPSKTLTISRSKYLPQMTIYANSELRRKQVLETTLQTFKKQILFAIGFEILNISLFGGLFAFLERWSFLEGIYFASTSLLTIGYGDYILCRMLSRSIFIWYAFLGIAATTYLGSMVRFG